MENKVCRKCNETKPLYEFHFRNDSGKYRNDCKECSSEENKKYRLLNRDKLIEKDRKRYEEKKLHRKNLSKEKTKITEEEKLHRKNISKEKTKITAKKYAEKNFEKLKAYRQEWEKNNKDKINKRKRERIFNNPILKLADGIRNSIKNSIKNKGYTKKSRTYEILDCSFEEFKCYLESKFENWMTWENKGLYNGTLNFGWDLDHIIPISSAKTEEDVIKLNHYTNFQPLCSKINRDIKKDHII